MLKLEIRLDEQQIIADRKYSVESIYQTLDQAFSRHGLKKEWKEKQTMCFYGSGNASDYGAFGCLITSLKEKSWFMDYVTRWMWYNSDNGCDETDFSVEDVLYHYTRKVSAA